MAGKRPSKLHIRSSLGRTCSVALLGAVVLASAGFVLRVTSPFVWAEESPDRQRSRVETMDSAAKERLLHRLESFQAMTPAQQERLRKLHAQIEQDPQSAELLQVMQRYYDWLKTLKPFQKAELAELPLRERVERIKKIKLEQARKDTRRANANEIPRAERIKRLLLEANPKIGKRLSQEDLEGLLRWIEQYMTDNEARLVSESPASQQQEAREQLARLKDPERRREALAAIWLQGQMAKPNKMPPLPSADLASLRSKLSPPTRQLLEPLPEAEQSRIVAFWLRLMLLNYTGSHHLARLQNQVSDEELAEFLEHKLNPELRDRLLSLPPDEMQRELWAHYLRSKMVEPPPANRPAAGQGKGQRANPKKTGVRPAPATSEEKPAAPKPKN